MKENIKELKYVVEENITKELEDKQKRELKQQYIEYLTLTIKDTFNLEFSKSEDFKYTYNTLILECDSYKQEILKEISNYYEIEKKSRYIKEDTKKEIYTIKKYVYNDFNIEEDIDNYYFKILKQVYNEYQLKEKAKKEEIKTYLTNSIYNAYDNYGYDKAHYLFYNIDYVNTIVEGITEDVKEQKYIKTIMHSIVNKIDREYKNYTTINEAANKKVQPRKNIVRRNKGKIFLGSAIYGFLKGMVDISKK